MRFFVACLSFLIFSLPSHGFDACEIDSSVGAFFGELVPDCEEKFDVSYKEILYVSQVEEDLSGIRPRIRETDIQLHAMVQGCGIEDDYFLWLREVDSGYEVVSYTSFSQPE